MVRKIRTRSAGTADEVDRDGSGSLIDELGKQKDDEENGDNSKLSRNIRRRSTGIADEVDRGVWGSLIDES
ncbi:hypothetical protein ACOME3_005090 [Neoechinorhynchus agilis]